MQNKEKISYTGLEELLSLEFLKNYNNAIVYDALKYSPNSFKIIDFGAGNGTLSLIFRNKYKKETLCIEIDPLNKEYLEKRNLKFYDNLDDLSKTADLIFSSNVLEHIKDDLQIMKSFNRTLKENGKLYLFVPAKMILWTKLDEIVGHYRRYEISDLKSLALQTGFEIERIHYADFCGFFITLLWKLFNKNNKSPLSKFSVIFYDNFIFPFSRILDKVGFKYFLGKNIVLVAKKRLII